METTKNKLFNTVIGMLVTVSLGLGGWQAKTLLEHEKQLAVIHNATSNTDARVAELENKGSRALDVYSHETSGVIKEHGARLDKLESAMLQLATVNGELKSIATRLDWVKESQARMENALEEHKKATMQMMGGAK